ncbi:MAG: phosphate/phosphite/phosphonate ABC transporter substrate-binding protein [Thermodesulfobacteriota bacterium]
MKRIGILAIALICVGLSSAAATAEMKIGMLAQRGPEAAIREWGGLERYLTETLGEKVTLVPLKFSEFMNFPKAEPAAFIFTNPWFFVRAKVRNGAEALVTVKYQASGATFGGVIFARKGAGLTSMLDLRNKVLMCPKFSSPGGWLFQKGEIQKHGLLPERDLKALLETEKESHDEVVYAVRDGIVDVGTVRTNLLETMQREGKIRIDDFVIINPTPHEDFPEACSTPLYPDWPVAALGKTPPQAAARMKQALLSVPPGHPALQQARRIERFVEALDYAPMENLCRFLRVAPFASLRRK